MMKRPVLIPILLGVFAVALVAAGAVGYYAAQRNNPPITVAQIDDEVFADPEEEVLVAEADFDATLFASATTDSLASQCTAVSVNETFNNINALPSTFVSKIGANYIVSDDGQLIMSKQPDLIKNNKRVILNHLPRVSANGEFRGAFKMSIDIIDPFSKPVALDTKYKKDRDLRTITGLRIRLSSNNPAEGNLGLILLQNTKGKYFLEVSRFAQGQYKLLERVDVAKYIKDDLKGYKVTLEMERTLDANGKARKVAPKVLFTKDGVTSTVTLESRHLEGKIRLASVAFRSHWQLTETKAFIDNISYTGCISPFPDVNTPSFDDGADLVEDELGL